MSRCTDKIAVVTGAGHRRGHRAPSRRGGAAVAVVDLSAERAQGSVDAVFAQIVADFGTLHTLVNNVGVTRDGLFFKMPKSDWDTGLQVNLTSAPSCAQAAQK